MCSNFPSREMVERVRRQFPVGCHVELLSMNDIQAPPVGTKGVVTGVDAAGTIHCIWSNGSTLGAVFGEDAVKIIKD